MGSVARMNTLQDMVKAAMAGATDRVSVAEEARQAQYKLAAESCKDCGKSECKCDKEKSASVSTDYAEKFAAALEYAIPFMKEAEVEPGSGPGALSVSETTRQDKIPENHGQATQQPPMRPGMQAGVTGPANQMQNDADRAPGGSEKMVQKNASAIRSLLTKKAEEDKKETEAKAEDKKEEKKAFDALAQGLIDLKAKVAEDKQNPAKISAGSAESTKLQTSAAGEAGGAPVGGAPQGPTGLVGSNESAINYNRAQARSGRKGEMGKYVDEPMMSGRTDSTLKDVLTHSSAADGNKFAGARDAAVKTAAAKALLAKLAEESDKKDSKSKDKQSMGPGSGC
jgi:hypothetical protein